ncbi:S8 family serine peptidase [Streptomyces sp. NBC_00984]|uniref:S8 family serine peptidase n=1 Tax=Streptomyces sp. NBC_00984 TaxID=2903700 RepID=UPI003866A774|nr:S8 family serine peptidase [Streptomyces sp. NBC_00984]
MGIVAARAADTSMGTPVDADYTSANGTSMATPHVSGAAAILAQRHPDWTADRLKQVLVGTAKQGSYTAYQQGGGRVDVPKALDATVYSSPAVVSMGKSSAESAPVTKTVNYVNTSAVDTTLSLRLFTVGETAPPMDGTFTLSDANVTVPANSTKSVTVTYHPELGAMGDCTAVITATATDGTAVHTTVGATKDVPTVDLTVNTIDRHGEPASRRAANSRCSTWTLVLSTRSTPTTGPRPSRCRRDATPSWASYTRGTRLRRRSRTTPSPASPSWS